MAPRTYRQQRRAESAAETRSQIIDVALPLYVELGVKGTTLKAVAERADVSRGTILNHFGSADGLFAAVLDRVVEQINYPSARLLDGVEGPDDRIRFFVETMVDFFVATRQWWPIFESEQGNAEFKRRESDYWEQMGQFQAAALGPELAGDPEANAILLGFVHPATVGTFIWAFEQASLETGRVRALLGGLAVEAIRRHAGAVIGKGGSS